MRHLFSGDGSYPRWARTLEILGVARWDEHLDQVGRASAGVCLRGLQYPTIERMRLTTAAVFLDWVVHRDNLPSRRLVESLGGTEAGQNHHLFNKQVQGFIG